MDRETFPSAANSTTPRLHAQSGRDDTESYSDAEAGVGGIISEILEEMGQQQQCVPPTSAAKFSTGSLVEEATDEIEPDKETLLISSDSPTDCLHNPTWRFQKKHIFILSEAGKPVFSLHGNEENLASIFGVIQALVSFVQDGQDEIKSIQAKDVQIVFLLKPSLILVAVSRTGFSSAQLEMQLNDVYHQIISTLTFRHLKNVFSKHKGFDLRRLLAGSERLIRHLVLSDSSTGQTNKNVFTFLTNSIRVLPMQASTRLSIVNAIKENCHNHKNLVFAVLIVNNQLITMVRMKKYSINPADLRLVFNLVESSESFKNYDENWTPLCLPRFDENGFLHAHVSYLAECCQACLLLFSVDKDDFFDLSEVKKRITEKLERTQCFPAINEAAIKTKKVKLPTFGSDIPELKHFLYKPKALAQLLCSDFPRPYNTIEGFRHLEATYCNLIECVHSVHRPLKLIYKAKSNEILLAWVTSAYELYAVFEPFAEKSTIIKHVDKLIKGIDKEFDTFFINSHPTF
uniref:Vacuolar fusion protein MON1 homolog n=1 Tax=Glossina palpalis gambiensis TaxID=67801 RepID=A0A1B0APT4_9MUSC